MKQIFVTRRLFFAVCLLSFAVSPQVAGLYAQDAQPDSVALKRELTLEREYNPVLKDASKINRLPEIKEPEAPRSAVEFSHYTIPYTLSPYLRPIPPSAYFSSLETSKHRGYLNLSAGVPLNIDGDWGYQLLNTNKDYLSIYASHHSTYHKVAHLHSDEKTTMKINDNNAGISYKHQFEGVKFTAGLQYLNAAFNYYGISAVTDFVTPVDTCSILNKNQVNHLFQLHAGIESDENDEINYKVNLAYNLFKQKYGCMENIKGPVESRYTVNFDLNAPFNSTNAVGLQGFLKSYFYQLSEYPALLPSFVAPTELAGKYNYATVSFNPYFTFTGDDWDVRLGANVDFQLGKVKSFLLSPNIRMNWLPAEKVQLYLNILGGIKDKGLYNTFFENRYVDPRFRLHDSKSPFDATLGINLSILPNVSLDIFTGYSRTKDEHFYITNYWPTISPIYTTAKTFKFGGLVKYAYRDIFNIGIQGVFYNWDCSGLEKNNLPLGYNAQLLYPWNRPAFTGNIESGFKIPDLPLQFNVNYQLSLGRKTYITGWERKENMKDIHDLSVKSTYSINSMLSIYAVANNLLFQKYDIWHGYPAQNFNIMGGISIKF